MIKIPILRESLDFYWLDDSIYVKTSLRHEEHWLEPQFKVLTHKTWFKQAFWLKWERKCIDKDKIQNIKYLRNGWRKVLTYGYQNDQKETANPILMRSTQNSVTEDFKLNRLIRNLKYKDWIYYLIIIRDIIIIVFIHLSSSLLFLQQWFLIYFIILLILSLFISFQCLSSLVSSLLLLIIT